MEEYNALVEKFKDPESKQQRLAQISRDYGFNVEEIVKDDTNGILSEKNFSPIR